MTRLFPSSESWQKEKKLEAAQNACTARLRRGRFAAREGGAKKSPRQAGGIQLVEKGEAFSDERAAPRGSARNVRR